MYSKTYFIRTLIESSGIKEPRILELACGTAHHVAPVLREHPECTYVGLEPYPPSFEKAKKEIGSLPNVTLVNQQGYGHIEGVEEDSFDIVFSLSALEHVKQLDKFIELSTRYAKHGALVVHRYDLGHALFSKSPKERFQVWLGNTFPDVLPENKFVRYVPQREVEGLFNAHGCMVERTTYHEMTGQKALSAWAEKEPLIAQSLSPLFSWEFEHAPAFGTMPVEARERLFPAVAVWGRKR